MITLLFSDPGLFFAYVTIFVIAITVHESAHAYAADRLGDLTPRDQGRLTLNPLSHLDPMGSLLFLFVGFGWGRPVMTNPYNLRPPMRNSMAIVAAAGPFSNLILALIAAIPVRFGLFDVFDIPSIGGITPTLSQFVSCFILINIGLMLFNLIPVPPLDGYKILLGLLPYEMANSFSRIEQYGPIILLLIFASGYLGFDIFGRIMGPAQRGLFTLITGH
jgi:Zn-dependent protease